MHADKALLDRDLRGFLAGNRELTTGNCSSAGYRPLTTGYRLPPLASRRSYLSPVSCHLSPFAATPLSRRLPSSALRLPSSEKSHPRDFFLALAAGLSYKEMFRDR
jgi:hypothetical protein